MPALTQSKKLYNGRQIPVLGLGTFQAKDPAELRKAIRVAVDETGYRHIDTAAVYQNEEIVGAAIKEVNVPREELYITSKCWVKDMGSKESVQKACEESLKKLDLKYLDLYLLHWPCADKDQKVSQEKILEAWKGMEHLLNTKKVRSIGVSNFMVEHLKEFLPNIKIVPHVNQVEAHPHLIQKHLSTFCKEKQIQIVAYRTLGCGKVIVDPAIIAMAEKYKRTPAQICLKWALQRDFCVIPKSVTPKRIQENAQIFDFEITQPDMETLDGLNADTHYCPNPHSWKDMVETFFKDE